MRNPTLIKRLAEALEGLAGEKVRIITHSGGDPDSIGSAYVLSNILRRIGVEDVGVIIPESISTHSRSLLSYLGLELGEVKGDEAYIVVDAGSPHQLGGLSETVGKGRTIVIDHHTTSHEAYGEGYLLFSSEDYQSVCEIVYELAEHLGYRLDGREAEALYLGMYYDTVRFSVADSETMRKACRLIELGVEPSTLLQEFEAVMDISERIARLKAAKRMKLYRIGGWLVALSHVGSFQSSVARSLLGLGAHVAVVAGEGDEGVQVSLRCVQEAVEAGLDLGRIASRLGEEFGGHGGGHAAASRAFCQRGGIDEVLSRSLNLISESFGAGAREVGD